ncbi:MULTISPECIES: hypothetical protein [unclassified Pseudomonas]|uniref:hypothetical protein n=1 Tax=unclassified Pseudomonas TaxID=196821 RepID=UPI0011BFBF41|nr:MULTISPECIES: hypothetical protein [unclassified Pseudomonas]
MKNWAATQTCRSTCFTARPMRAVLPAGPASRPLSALNQPSIPQDNPGPNNLYGYAAQMSVASTVLRHMGLDLLPEWKLDGTPLLGTTGVRKARAIEGDAKLLWNSDSQGTVIIHKNDQIVANVPAYLQQWTNPQGMRQASDYVLELDDTPIAVRTRPVSKPFIIEQSR